MSTTPKNLHIYISENYVFGDHTDPVIVKERNPKITHLRLGRAAIPVIGCSPVSKVFQGAWD
jgi:hypothetical protein